ncbi:helix-turn-helix transcriptional regulator [Tsuneonella troitsensis]|uniref:helix-turn-helix transcriptional regulator n=1 Tax=Tsuneonella troitsensis TaxID=292222 RepID=UPI000A738BFA|nr:helix-turn-helix domain-containing protein [Tsuneonella troitsensis]
MQTNPHVFLTTEEAAARWSMSARTLEGWRDKGIGPIYHKIGSRVRYHVDDIERFEKLWRSSDHHFAN